MQYNIFIIKRIILSYKYNNKLYEISCKYNIEYIIYKLYNINKNI